MNGLLSLRGKTAAELEQLIDAGSAQADRLASGERYSQSLRGRVITTLFFEDSTRTRLSFEQAARFLGAEVMTFHAATSSTSKGESLEDTARTLGAIGTDLFVVRHTREDGPSSVATATGIPVVNGGNGRSEHPTQTLLDALTLKRKFASLSGLSIGVVGDVINSRVASGMMLAFPLLGVKLTLIGPESLLPPAVPEGVAVDEDLDAVLPRLDAVYMLRIQKERGAETGFETDSAYSERFGLDDRRSKALPDHAVVMHPGPMNRGVEIAGTVADGPRSLIETQVAMGVPMRMAVMMACLGREL